MKKQTLKQEQDYVDFLKKRLGSEHFMENATPEEIEKTKIKYDKAKLKLRMLQKGQL